MGALDNYQWQEKDVYLNSVYLFSKRPVATLGGFPGLKPEAIVGALPGLQQSENVFRAALCFSIARLQNHSSAHKCQLCCSPSQKIVF